ncbi:MAG: hypothetical protein KGH94_05555 [Candidatus Micrarchaeota archaeon]|nr:hypothetical protein [Candidatus Micrarchaeota archaeon]
MDQLKLGSWEWTGQPLDKVTGHKLANLLRIKGKGLSLADDCGEAIITIERRWPFKNIEVQLLHTILIRKAGKPSVEIGHPNVVDFHMGLPGVGFESKSSHGMHDAGDRVQTRQVLNRIAAILDARPEAFELIRR